MQPSAQPLGRGKKWAKPRRAGRKSKSTATGEAPAPHVKIKDQI